MRGFNNNNNNNNNNNQANFYGAITSPQAILGCFAKSTDLDKQITQNSIVALSWIRLQEKFSLEPGLEQLECGSRARFQC